MGRIGFTAGLLLGLVAAFLFGVNLVGKLDAQCKQEKTMQLDDSVRKFEAETSRINAEKVRLSERIVRLNDEIAERDAHTARLNAQTARLNARLSALQDRILQLNDTKRDVWFPSVGAGLKHD